MSHEPVAGGSQFVQFLDSNVLLAMNEGGREHVPVTGPGLRL